jgi:hypothetical protein
VGRRRAGALVVFLGGLMASMFRLLAHAWTVVRQTVGIILMVAALVFTLVPILPGTG